MKAYLYCHDLNLLRPFYCCSSCHEDEDYGYAELCDRYPSVKGLVDCDDYNGNVVLLVCCAATCDGLTRDDYAQMIRLKRKAAKAATKEEA